MVRFATSWHQKSMWHNWKSAQVVNSHLVCDPTIRQLGFDLLGNRGLCWTIFARNRDTAVPTEGNGNLQTLICVLVARPRRCLTLSNPVPWQNWMATYLGYTLQMRTLVSWLTSFGSWNAYEKNKTIIIIITCYYYYYYYNTLLLLLLL